MPPHAAPSTALARVNAFRVLLHALRIVMSCVLLVPFGPRGEARANFSWEPFFAALTDLPPAPPGAARSRAPPAPGSARRGARPPGRWCAATPASRRAG